MDSLKKLVKSAPRLGSEKGQLYSAYAIFGAAALYIFYNGKLSTLGLAVGIALVAYVVAAKNLTVALIAGALGGLIALHYSRYREGFETHSPTSDDDEEAFEGEDAEDDEEPPKKAEGFAASRKRRAPDNGERAEKFELGKKYKMPDEGDDADFHLDAGTTFMNAYKSLKPEQIAAMTKDTQELMQTQRQLMSTLSTLKPLIQDGKQMMDMFQGYFGNGNNSMN
jgi:hypothetical protein